MSIYTVHMPPLTADQPAPHPERFVFVRDGFAFWAFLLAPLWMLRHRLWLAFMAYVVLAVGLQTGLHFMGAPVSVRVAAGALLASLVGLEAATLRRLTLARRGWTNIGTVVGDDLEAAERRFFDSWIGSEAPPAPPRPLMPAALLRTPAPHSEIVGLFPNAGGAQ